jgi:hypothetical protein
MPPEAPTGNRGVCSTFGMPPWYCFRSYSVHLHDCSPSSAQQQKHPAAGVPLRCGYQHQTGRHHGQAAAFWGEWLHVDTFAHKSDIACQGKTQRLCRALVHHAPQCGFLNQIKATASRCSRSACSTTCCELNSHKAMAVQTQPSVLAKHLVGHPAPTR